MKMEELTGRYQAMVFQARNSLAKALTQRHAGCLEEQPARARVHHARVMGARLGWVLKAGRQQWFLLQEKKDHWRVS